MSDNKNDNQDDLLMDHEYDGIQELDNPLPNWWLGIFWITMIFGVIYYFYYEFGGGPSSNEELNESLAQISSKQKVVEQAAPQKDEAELIALVSDSSALEKGKAEYIGKCAACHGQAGEGGIGPNLTDIYWIHNKGTVSNIVEMIQTGVADKGMPPWKGIITQDNIYNLAAYVKSLQGSQPAGAKAPQGELVRE